MVSELFDAKAWRAATGVDFTDITYHRAVEVGAVRVAFNRPEVRNAFRPQMVDELYRNEETGRLRPSVVRATIAECTRHFHLM
jgi:naphthoate synthase